MIEGKYVKIVFKFVDEDTEELITESLWAIKENNYYKVDNIPFYVYLYSTDDIVQVKSDNGELVVEKLIEASGNSTVRILFDNEEELYRIKEELSLLNCDSEVSKRNKLLAVNIPKTVSYTNILQYLESVNDLQYEESCISENHKEQMV